MSDARELVALDPALERLKVLNQRQSRVIECRYFGGLTIEETADVPGIERILLVDLGNGTFQTR